MTNIENIESILKTWKTSRKLCADYLEAYSLEQLNKIPGGFNNNLIWNLGHIIVAQQGLVYKSSDLEGHVPDRLFELYRPGTKPTGKTSQEEADELKDFLTILVDKTIDDLNKGVFKTYKERMTRTGFHLSSLADALEFNNYHEGLHLGYMMSIRKFV